MTPRDEEGPLQVGTRFLEKYEIRGRLGHGGQAWIYLGQHIFTARDVAIKIIHSPHGVTREMLMRGKSEARALGKLDHPNIVVMHDAGVTDEGLFYIVMELLRGHSLRAVLDTRSRLGVEELLRLAIQAGEAVHAAHEVQMIHRDLKPDNIYLTKDNRLKVLDFGIAKMLNEIGFTTRKDIVIGSLLYMSPEQVLGLPITAQTDVCALGLMMFEALIGVHPSLLVFERDLIAHKAPYRRAGLADIPPIQVGRLPPLLCELDPAIPSYVAEVVHRAIAKIARDRFATMRDFISAMRVCLERICSERPIRARGTSERDLSQHPVEASETPGSQRVTPKCGFQWESARSFAPSVSAVGGSAQPRELHGSLGVTRALPAQSGSVMPDTQTVQATPESALAMFGPLKAATLRPVAVGHRSTDRRVPPGRAPMPVRNAIIGGCLFGAALGSVGALLYAGTASPAVSLATAAPSAATAAAMFQNSEIALLPPLALPSTAEPARPTEPRPESSTPAAVERVRVASALAPVAPVKSGAPATVHARQTTAQAVAVASARAVDKPAEGVGQLDSDLGGDRSKNSRPSASDRKARAKLINGGRLIYGD